MSLVKLRRVGVVAALVGAVCGGAWQVVVCQTSTSGAARRRDSSNSSAGAAVVSRTMTGRVINSITGAAMPRALVNLNSRMMLTDAQGRYSFADFTETQGYIMVTKPGFSQNPDAGMGASQQRIVDMDAVQEIKLYPDALVTGTVVGPDGLPISRVQMRIRRLTFDTNGPRWSPVGFSQTDAHGQYRYSGPAGRYRITSEFVQRTQETGESVLPAAVPSVVGGNLGEYLELHAGEVQEVNLRPKVGPASQVVVKLGLVDGQRGVSLMATGSSGVPFRLQSRGRPADGEYLVELPPGSYTLRAILQNREDAFSGTAHVTVTGRGLPPEVPIQMSPATVFPVEAVFQASTVATGPTAAASATPLNVKNINLSLQNRANDGDGGDGDVGITGRGDAPPEMRVMPGRYRLSGARYGPWTVVAATCGPTDLLREDLVVGPGAAGTPIRLVLSNARGQLHGTVTAAGAPAAGWVYLLPAEPGLVPDYEIVLQTDGTYRWMGPPGKYTAVVSDHQIHEDFRDAKFVARLSAGGRAVEVTEGGETAADLTTGVPTS